MASTTVQIDTTAPVLGAPGIETDPSTGFVTVTLSATDGGSGLKEITYRLGPTDLVEKTYTEPIVIEEDVQLLYFTYDNAGNQTSGSLQVDVLDLTVAVTLTANPDTVEVGAVTVPLAASSVGRNASGGSR